ncbi:unnamed protein product [Pedinophyceae sp. YPF-701]|nr:unnamed protein product [Pedinophyceae sp. YPF-701]
MPAVLLPRAPSAAMRPSATARAAARAPLAVRALPPLRKAPAPRTLVTARAEAEAPAARPGYINVQEQLEFGKFRLGGIALPVGLTLMVYGFGAYFQILPGTDFSPLMLVYGFPISVIGAALNYAELKPVTCFAQPEALEARDSQATAIQKQVREDCTRYRYGDEQHLDEALPRIFMIGRPGGIRRPQTPKLTGLREEMREGKYTLVMEFDSPDLEFEEWTKREDKMTSFFGPNIKAFVEQGESTTDVALVRTD